MTFSSKQDGGQLRLHPERLVPARKWNPVAFINNNCKDSFMDIPEDWLEAFNRDAAERGIPHIQRPWLAISEWTRQKKCSTVFGSPSANKVFAWFEARSPERSLAIGPLYTGTFLYDSYFWKVSIPVMYGTPHFNLLNFISDMPNSTRQGLKSQREAITQFACVGADCLDYAYGTDDISKGGATTTLSRFAVQLFRSADGYLRGTVDLLTASRTPNSRAMEAARLATEMFLKAYLVTHVALDEPGAKRLGHHVDKIAAECVRQFNLPEFKGIAGLVAAFPDVNARYQGEQYDPAALWNAYAVAQQAGTTFVRSATDRDVRPVLFGKGGCI